MRTSPDARTKHPFEFFHLSAVAIALAAAGAQFARFFYIALSRLAFPFSLEWMEGGSYVQVSRILEGQPLYVRPSFEFIPQIYPPVYFYISALASKVLGNSFVPLRLVSILATVGILILIYLLVHRASGSKLSGILASGFFCATYALSGHWFDIARVDSLALAFLLLAAFFLLKDQPMASVLSGIFLALSCFTKQTMLIVAGMFLLYSLFPLRKNGLLFTGTMALVFLSGTAILNGLSDGWYSYYSFHLPGRHNLLPDITTLLVSSRDILFEQIIRPVFIATVIGLVYLCLFPVQRDVAETGSQFRKEASQLDWSRRAVWTLVLGILVWAIASLWYLATLPSDAEGGVLGPYSLARLTLMAGPVFAGILALLLADRMRKNPAWTDQITNRLFGTIHFVPRLLVAVTVIVLILVVVFSYLRPGLFEALNTSLLQRLSPYLIGPAVFLILMLALWRLAWSSYRLEAWFFLLLVSGLVATSWLGRLNPGGYTNVFMTAYAGIAILFGSGIGLLLEEPSPGQPVSRTIVSTIVLLLTSAQLIILFSPPSAQIPTQADEEAGQELVSRIRACPGEVYIPFHTYLAELAGKDGYAGVVEMGELRGSFGGKADPLWDEVLYQIQSSLDAHTFVAIIQDNQVFRDALSGSYVETGQVFEQELVFWPVTGRKVRPETVYVPARGEGCLLAGE